MRGGYINGKIVGGGGRKLPSARLLLPPPHSYYRPFPFRRELPLNVKFIGARGIALTPFCPYLRAPIYTFPADRGALPTPECPRMPLPRPDEYHVEDQAWPLEPSGEPPVPVFAAQRHKGQRAADTSRIRDYRPVYAAVWRQTTSVLERPIMNSKSPGSVTFFISAFQRARSSGESWKVTVSD